MLGSGVNVTSPVSLFNVNSPISSPSGFLAFTFSAGCPFSSNNVVLVLSINTTSEPALNSTVPFWTAPWTSTEVASSAVGYVGVMFGVYVVTASVPFSSNAPISAAGTTPT